MNGNAVVLVIVALIVSAVLATHALLSYKVWQRFDTRKALLATAGLTLAAYAIYTIALSPVLLFVAFAAPGTTYVGGFDREDLLHLVNLDFANICDYFPDFKDANRLICLVVAYTVRLGLFLMVALLVALFARRNANEPNANEVVTTIH